MFQGNSEVAQYFSGAANQYHVNMIIISSSEYVSKCEGVHDSWLSIQSHWKPVYLDETSVEEIVVVEISFTQCGSRARLHSAATAVPISCGVL